MVLLIGPLIAVIGILVAVYVLRGKASQKRSLYSSQRDRLAHKVQEARERTLAPIARAEKEAEKREKEAEKKASRHGHGAPAEAPAAKSAWEYSPTAPAPSAPMEPSSTRAGEPAWTPTSAPPSAPPPPPLPPVPAPTPAQPVAEPSAPPWHPTSPESELEAPAAAGPTGWSVVDAGGKESGMAAAAAGTPTPAAKGGWEVVGQAPEAEKILEEKKPSAAVGAVQYAVLVVGLVMILIGCLVMIANVRTG